ncbi:HAMP domain-containing sensor histidine kinase [Paenibacillus sp. MMS20-IR301]|uniref:sensor histidine kinase n=1 Tax=Paenibacillus sp. MMS20-IR301 TaxID=2895946 RepID=UPI0028EFF034|nr:HAMP domain-containing sensor histidine kinase [Paenibacillus sp. MMS20-IR301]WNS41381.1 HAMP domain-containing sensor histidine kinase [Paenibacillus sp. MMS20-IR301]
MIRSLYTRVVLIFLVSVIGGTVLSFFVATWLYRDKLNENLQIPMLRFGKDIVRIYDTFPDSEADDFVRGMNQLQSYYIRIYEAAGQYQSYSEPPGAQLETITAEQVNQVLAGAVVQGNKSGLSTTLLGLPLTTDNGTKAMFIEPIGPPSSAFVLEWITNFSVYSLLTGSIVILVAAMFVVRPIKKLTTATRRIAAGDFNVKLNIKQQGELGTLARSFEEMMIDLQQLEQLRRDFVSNVSHEVQSPLTSISGYALALKQMNLPDSERSRYLDIIIAEADRMSKLSDSLLKLSLLESQTQQLQLSTLSLDEQVRRVIVALQPQWSARSIRFDLQLKTVRLTADHDLLNQVWTNLLGNSIKFSADGGRISVSMKQELKQVAIRISDDGIGISPEDQKRIFERFFKADRSHNRKVGGSGMGLAIVKQIVLLHHGDVRVESEPGRGSTFTVTLPLTAPDG